jgi:hypothetical protein
VCAIACFRAEPVTPSSPTEASRGREEGKEDESLLNKVPPLLIMMMIIIIIAIIAVVIITTSVMITAILNPPHRCRPHPPRPSIPPLKRPLTRSR